jgi:group I intron endonuclease
MIGIYLITNTVNNKVYVGKSGSSMEARWYRESRGKTNRHFAAAIKKYGVDNFRFSVLVEAKDHLNDLEKEYISKYRSYDPRFGYNKTLGGDGGIPTEETRDHMIKNHWSKRSNSDDIRKKISEHTKMAMTPEISAKISAHNLGMKMSKETKEKMHQPRTKEHRENISRAQLGHKRPRVRYVPGSYVPSEETRRKISEATTGKYMPPPSEELIRRRAEANKHPRGHYKKQSEIAKEHHREAAMRTWAKRKNGELQ